MNCNDTQDMYDDDVEVTFSVGRRFLTGNGVEKDIERARKLLGEAAAQGHPLAQQLLDSIASEPEPQAATPVDNPNEVLTADGWLRINCATQSEAELALAAHHAQLVHRFNQSLPFSEEWTALQHEIFEGRIGEGSRVMSPLTAVRPHKVTIGRDVVVMNGALMMSAGGITLDDHVRIAANCQLITNSHDPYNRDVITCRPIHVCEGAWVGAGTTILPGVRIGRWAIVGAASVVTRDIPDYAVAVGNPARVIKTLDESRFE